MCDGQCTPCDCHLAVHGGKPINVEQVYSRHDHLALAARQYDMAGQRMTATAFRIAMRRAEGFTN